jgi:DNA polymerase-3 subunit delta'
MVEKLYYAAAPKILKALEEPPPKTLFLLVCESHDQVLNTILSRTQLVKVHRFDDLAIMRYLTTNHALDEVTAKRIVPLANGSITEAIRLLRRTEEEQRNFQRFRQLLQLCYKNDYQGIAELTDSIAASGRENIKSFLAYGLSVIRYSVLKNTQNIPLIRLEGEELDFILKLSSVVKLESSSLFAEELSKAVFHIERNGAPRIVLLDMGLCFVDFFNRFR